MEYLSAIRDFEGKTGRELDAIIAPITPTAAIRHNQFKYYGYATAINVLDFTSVVVPVTFADKNIDVKTADFVPLNDLDALVHQECETLSVLLHGLERGLAYDFQMIRRHTMARQPRCKLLAVGLPKRESWPLRRKSADYCVHRVRHNQQVHHLVVLKKKTPVRLEHTSPLDLDITEAHPQQT
jgi:hypothetical protein